MRATIIADDGVVGVDGEFRNVDLSALDANIHAVQWDGVSGHVEYRDRRPETALTDISAYQPFIDAWQDAAPPPPLPPLPPPSKAEIIDAAFREDTMAGLLGEVADLKGVTESQLIASIKTRRGV